MNQFEGRRVWGQTFSWVNQFGVENQQKGWISFKALSFSVAFTFSPGRSFLASCLQLVGCVALSPCTPVAAPISHACAVPLRAFGSEVTCGKNEISCKRGHKGDDIMDRASVFWKVTEAGWLWCMHVCFAAHYCLAVSFRACLSLWSSRWCRESVCSSCRAGLSPHQPEGRGNESAAPWSALWIFIVAVLSIPVELPSL